MQASSQVLSRQWSMWKSLGQGPANSVWCRDEQGAGRLLQECLQFCPNDRARLETRRTRSNATNLKPHRFICGGPRNLPKIASVAFTPRYRLA